jgi:hypothetical protein
MSASHQIDIDPIRFDAMVHDQLLFHVFQDTVHYQTGDTVKFRKLSRDGGVEPKPGSRWDAVSTEFTLGFMVRGTNAGIRDGWVGFQLLRK